MEARKALTSGRKGLGPPTARGREREYEHRAQSGWLFVRGGPKRKIPGKTNVTERATLSRKSENPKGSKIGNRTQNGGNSMG